MREGRVGGLARKIGNKIERTNQNPTRGKHMQIKAKGLSFLFFILFGVIVVKWSLGWWGWARWSCIGWHVCVWVGFRRKRETRGEVGR